MKKTTTKLFILIAIVLLGITNLDAQTYHAISAEETVDLTQTNVNAQDWITATDNWATNKSYCGYTAETFFNMSSTGRIMTVNVSNVASFDVFVQNTTVGRNLLVTIADGTTINQAHGATGCESFTFNTGNTGDIVIKFEGGGVGSVYPTKIVLKTSTGGTTSVNTSSSEAVNITFDGKTIRNVNNEMLKLYDATGRLIFSSTDDISMANRPTGIYVIKSLKNAMKIANLR